MITNFLNSLKRKSRDVGVTPSLDNRLAPTSSKEPYRIYNIRLILSNGENDATYFKYSCEGCFRTLNTLHICMLPEDKKTVEKDFPTYKEAFKVFKQLDQRFVDNFHRNTFHHFELATFFIQRVIVNDPGNSFKDEYSVLIKSSFKPQTFEEKIKSAIEYIA